MYKHSFLKNMTDKVRQSYEKAFSQLEPVSTMRPSRYELPLTSIRRILGDKFYEMKNSEDDVLTLHVYDNGIFSTEDMTSSLERGTELTQFMCDVFFNGFLANLSHQFPIKKEDTERKLGKLCITSESKGLETFEVSLQDLNSLCTSNADGDVTGIRFGVEFTKFANEINTAQQAYQKMMQTGNQSAAATIEQNIKEYESKLFELQNKWIEKFVEDIVGLSGVEAFEDIHDVTLLFGTNVVNEEKPEESYVTTTCFTYHDQGSKDVSSIKTIFKVDEILEQQKQ